MEEKITKSITHLIETKIESIKTKMVEAEWDSVITMILDLFDTQMDWSRELMACLPKLIKAFHEQSYFKQFQTLYKCFYTFGSNSAVQCVTSFIMGEFCRKRLVKESPSIYYDFAIEMDSAFVYGYYRLAEFHLEKGNVSLAATSISNLQQLDEKLFVLLQENYESEIEARVSNAIKERDLLRAKMLIEDAELILSTEKAKQLIQTVDIAYNDIENLVKQVTDNEGEWQKSIEDCNKVLSWVIDGINSGDWKFLDYYDNLLDAVQAIMNEYLSSPRLRVILSAIEAEQEEYQELSRLLQNKSGVDLTTRLCKAFVEVHEFAPDSHPDWDVLADSFYELIGWAPDPSIDPASIDTFGAAQSCLADSVLLYLTDVFKVIPTGLKNIRDKSPAVETVDIPFNTTHYKFRILVSLDQTLKQEGSNILPITIEMLAYGLLDIRWAEIRKGFSMDPGGESQLSEQADGDFSFNSFCIQLLIELCSLKLLGGSAGKVEIDQSSSSDESSLGSWNRLISNHFEFSLAVTNLYLLEYFRLLPHLDALYDAEANEGINEHRWQKIGDIILKWNDSMDVEILPFLISFGQQDYNMYPARGNRQSKRLGPIFERKTPQERIHEFVDCTTAILGNFAYYERRRLCSELDSNDFRYFKSYFDSKETFNFEDRYSTNFISNCLQFIEETTKRRLNPPAELVENVRSFLMEYLGTYLWDAGYYRKYEIPRSQLAIHFDSIARIFYDLNQSMTGLYFETFGYYTNRNFGNAICLLEQKLKIIPENIRLDEPFLPTFFPWLAFSTYTYQIEEHLSSGLEIGPVMGGLAQVFQRNDWGAANEVAHFINYFSDFETIRRGKKLEIVSEQGSSQLLGFPNYQALRWDIQFSIGIKCLASQFGGWEAFIQNWAKMSQSQTFLELEAHAVFSPGIIAAFRSFDQIFMAPKKGYKYNIVFDEQIEMLMLQVFSFLNAIPKAELLKKKRGERIGIQEKIELLIEYIQESWRKFTLYKPLFIYFVFVYHYQDHLNTLTISRIKALLQIGNHIKESIHQFYGPLQLYFWNYLDQNILDEVVEIQEKLNLKFISLIP
jgi:hypothetical protein